MTTVSAGQGLVPVFHPSGLTRPQRFLDAIDATVTQTIYKGTPVRLTTAGLIIPLANAAWAAAADDFIGVFDGIEWTDSDGRRRVSNRWIGPQTVFSPANMFVFVWTNPDIVYEAQANGSVAATALGDEFNFVNQSAGSSVTGLSSTQLNATPVGAGNQGYVRAVNLSPLVNNTWGDAFTVLQVKIATHEFIADKVAI